MSKEDDKEAKLDAVKAKEVLADIECMGRRIARLARRFDNTKDQANAVATTLRLVLGIEQAIYEEKKLDKDLPATLSLRVSFRLDEHNNIDATIGGYLLPVGFVLEQILMPLASAGMTGLEVMREEIEDVEEVVGDADINYEAHTRNPPQEELN